MFGLFILRCLNVFLGFCRLLACVVAFGNHVITAFLKSLIPFKETFSWHTFIAMTFYMAPAADILSSARNLMLTRWSRFVTDFSRRRLKLGCIQLLTHWNGFDQMIVAALESSSISNTATPQHNVVTNLLSSYFFPYSALSVLILFVYIMKVTSTFQFHIS